MKFFLSLLFLVGLMVSTTVTANCDPRYYKPNTCEPYYVHPNPQLPHNPMHTTSRNPADYTHGRMGVNSGYPRMGACAYGSCGGYVGNNNYGWVGGHIAGHVHGTGCGHARQSRYINWTIGGSIGSYGNGTNGRIGGQISGGTAQTR